MSTQAAFYQDDQSLDSLFAPEFLHLHNGFSPESISLPSLEKENLPCMQLLSNQTGSMQAMAPNMQGEGNDIKQPRLHNRALRPAPGDGRKESIDAEISQASPLLHSNPSMPSFSSFSFSSCGAASHGTEFGFDNDRVSPPSDMSSNKSSFPLRWQNRDTDKRVKNLERNRAAASKSRQKKKRETDQLQVRFQEVSRRRSSLDSEIKSLHSQLLSLKDQILLHSRCEDEAIRLYLSRMVKQATKHESISSTTDELDNGDARNYRQHSDSVSISADHSPSEMELSYPRHPPMNMGDLGGRPCGADYQVFSQPPDADIFDFLIDTPEILSF